MSSSLQSHELQHSRPLCPPCLRTFYRRTFLIEKMLTMNLISPLEMERWSPLNCLVSHKSRFLDWASRFPQQSTAYTRCQVPEVYSHVWSFRRRTSGRSRAAPATTTQPSRGRLSQLASTLVHQRV